VKKKPTLAQQEVSVSFEGPCRPDHTELKAVLHANILGKLEEKNLCERAQCFQGNVSIHCGPPPPKRPSALPNTFDTRWNITMQSRSGQLWFCLGTA
jgi:hypothetical protein